MYFTFSNIPSSFIVLSLKKIFLQYLSNKPKSLPGKDDFENMGLEAIK
jgi:hypothetical protein